MTFTSKGEMERTWLAIDAGTVFGEALVKSGILQGQDGGADPALPPDIRQVHDVRAAAQFQHLTLADESLVFEWQAQLQVADEQVEPIGAACDFVNLRLQAVPWDLRAGSKGKREWKKGEWIFKGDRDRMRAWLTAGSSCVPTFCQHLGQFNGQNGMSELPTD